MFMKAFIVTFPLFLSIKELIKEFEGNIAVIASTFTENVKGIYPFYSMLAWISVQGAYTSVLNL